MSFLINPYAFLAAGGDFESIATVTVGSGGASSIEFTSIPGTYQHLQVRYLGRTDHAVADYYWHLQFNSDTGSNYAWHWLYGSGATAATDEGTSASQILTGRVTGSSASSSIFGTGIVDVLDYANTSKNKTVREFAGNDRNGAGYVFVSSGLWMSTAAISSVKMSPASGNWAQYTTAALYGLRAP